MILLYFAVTFLLCALVLQAFQWLALARLRQRGLYPARGQVSEADIRQLLDRGAYDLAIRAYREYHGVDSRTASLAINSMKQGLHFPYC
ncbi:hypothetical protein A11A3_02987 [Alcanivorax hongdengensis A-11-3]|uniref:Uncharacterized protein n=1 Tax=Alcanivorax hongdengensis A-11-3 TaxID=1177179 RepID=L0WIX7_9GAMM|nr:hypothetical protein [Alcanivorax hongdengensis]EKF75800.1 hypothetical protein A11A3_02987 [Alcanivorax hongdengensis A-11-3]